MAPFSFFNPSVSSSVHPPLLPIHKSRNVQMICRSPRSQGAKGLTMTSLSLPNLRTYYAFSKAKVPIQASSEAQIITRHTADFAPSIWGNRFLEYKYDQMALDATSQKLGELKEEARKILVARATDPPLPLMDLIDTLQRLGVAYHFETEIEEAMHNVFNDNYFYDSDDLYATALGFRLLRQHGYHVSCDVFFKYKDKSGNFRANLTDDISGMLSLYEASHLRVHGEEILDEALSFTSSNLMSRVNGLSPPIAKQVSHSLRRPLHKNMPRLEAREYISIYEEDYKHNKLLLDFAKRDFNHLQSLHLNELSELSKWWKDLSLTSKLPFIRERLVEDYFWVLGTYFEPQYSVGRIILTKTLAIVSAIDDIYDSYATLKELDLFTAAFKRWDISAIHQLPEYMKTMYLAVLDYYNEIENELGKEGKQYLVLQAKELFKDLTEAEHIEQKWFTDGYIPTVEEYIENALVSSTFVLLPFISFLGMGDIVPKETYDWVKNDVIPVRAFAMMGRLMDDIQSHKFEQERGHGASFIECYMNQYSVSEEETYHELSKMVDQEWKNLNQGCLKRTEVPRPLLERVVNITRMIDVIFKYGDGYNNPHLVLKDQISSLLIDPIPIRQ